MKHQTSAPVPLEPAELAVLDALWPADPNEFRATWRALFEAFRPGAGMGLDLMEDAVLTEFIRVIRLPRLPQAFDIFMLPGTVAREDAKAYGYLLVESRIFRTHVLQDACVQLAAQAGTVGAA